jgi:ABC-type bacteriocin/lantibiotic exporter with double-glycine peptidase domain
MDSIKDDKLDSQIIMKKASFKWDKEDNSPNLSNISLDVKPNKLIAIVGKVGSGKSSLLSALLGEMSLIEGQTKIRGSLAYVPQQAWIQNATVRANILFGKEFHPEKYKKVIRSCALEPDLTLLSG